MRQISAMQTIQDVFIEHTFESRTVVVAAAAAAAAIVNRSNTE